MYISHKHSPAICSIAYDLWVRWPENHVLETLMKTLWFDLYLNINYVIEIEKLIHILNFSLDSSPIPDAFYHKIESINLKIK